MRAREKGKFFNYEGWLLSQIPKFLKAVTKYERMSKILVNDTTQKCFTISHLNNEMHIT